MRPNQARLGAGIAALAGLWIAVYWWWDPSPEPAIRFDTAAATGPDAAEPTGRSRQRRAAAADRAGGGERGGRSAEESPAAAEGPVAPPEPAGVVPPDFYEYIVQEGDTSLEMIAEKLLGDAQLWFLIAQSNELRDPQRLRPGQVWRIPLDESNLQGVVVDADGRTITPAREPATPANEEFVEYVVQTGDSLSVISQRLYGTQKHAAMLFELNRQRLGLRSADSIRVGQVLQAPKSPPE